MSWWNFAEGEGREVCGFCVGGCRAYGRVVAGSSATGVGFMYSRAGSNDAGAATADARWL